MNLLHRDCLQAPASDQPRAGFSPELPQSGQSTSRTVLSNPPSTSGGSSGASSAGGDTHAVPAGAGGPGITERLPSSTPRTATQAETATPPSKLPQKSGRIEQQEPFYGFPSSLCPTSGPILQSQTITPKHQTSGRSEAAPRGRRSMGRGLGSQQAASVRPGIGMVITRSGLVLPAPNPGSK